MIGVIRLRAGSGAHLTPNHTIVAPRAGSAVSVAKSSHTHSSSRTVATVPPGGKPRRAAPHTGSGRDLGHVRVGGKLFHGDRVTI